MTAYNGETIRKKMVRAAYWAQVWDRIGPRRFFAGKHLVLASRFGGDISCLVGMGVHQNNIVACDLDTASLDAVVERFPGVECLHGDVTGYNGGPLISAYLDFCSWQTAAVFRACRAMLDRMAPASWLGVTTQRGRESRAVMGSIRSSRAKKIKHPLADGRLRRFVSLMAVNTASARRKVICDLVMPYQGHRVPMIVIGFSVDPVDRRPPVIVGNVAKGSPGMAVRQARVFERENWDPAKVLNVSPATLAAWRAHATRGTYS